MELSTTATPKNFSDIDLDVSGTFYHGRITNDPVVTRNFREVFWGWIEVNEVTFRLANLDNALDAHYNEDPRATLLVVKRYDVDSETNITEFTGVVSDIAMGDGWIEIRGVSPDLSFLRQKIPTTIVDTTLFGDYAVNLGVRVPLVFGTVDKAPLLYVNDNTVSNQYDYVVSHGSVSVTAVYRPLPTGLLETVPAADYTVSDSLYSGYTVVRFTTRQVDFSDNYLSMFADVTGYSEVRNFAKAIETLLSSTTYGCLSETIDTTTFNQAVEDLKGYDEIVLDDAPVGYWRLGEAAGATTAQDGTSNNLDGTYQGSPTLGISGALAGDEDTAVELNGSNQWVSIADNDLLDFTTTFSLEAWLRADSLAARYILAKDDAGSTPAGAMRLGINSAGALELRRGTNDTATSADPITAGVWHHVVVTFDNTANPKVNFYIDGATAGTSNDITAAFTANAQTLLVGRRGAGGYWDGAIDEVAVYSTILSAARVAAHYAATDGPRGLLCDGLVQEPREAQDILRQLMMVRGMRLGWTSAGAITLTVDKLPTTVRMVVRDGEGDGERNLLRILSPRKRKALHEATKDVVIRYKPDYFANVPRLEARKTVRSGFGFDREIEHDYIRDQRTADKIAKYLAKREEFDEQVEVELTQEARQLGPADLVSTDYAALGGTYLETLRVEKKTDRARALLGAWSAEFYGYDGGNLPTDRASQLAQQAADTPAVPTGLALATAVESEGADGLLTASVTATWTASTEADLNRYLLRLRTSGGSQYEPSEAPKGTEAATWKGLLTSTEYAVSIRAEDRFGNRSLWSDETTIASAKDATAPDTVTTVRGTGGAGHTRLSWNNPIQRDVAHIEVWRSETNDRSTATLVGQPEGTVFVDRYLPDDTLFYYWLRAVDRTGNASGWHTGDTSGLPVRTPRVAGYRQVDDVQVFATGRGTTILAAGVDQSDNELDVLQVDTSDADIYWGESTLDGKQQTALGSKIVGTFTLRPPAAVSDSTGDLHLAVVNSGATAVQYGRLDMDGTVEQALTNKFTESPLFVTAPSIATSGSLLYFVWVYKDQILRFGTTNLSGTVQTSAATIADHDGELHGSGNGNLVIRRTACWPDADGNLHVLYLIGDDGADDQRELYYVKCSSVGAVLVGPETKFATPSGASDTVFNLVGMYVDAMSHVVCLANSTMGPGGVPGSIFFATLRSDTGDIKTPMVVVLTDNAFSGATLTADPRDDTVFLIRSQNTTGTPIQLTRFSRADG